MWLRIFAFLSIFLYLGQFPAGNAMQKNQEIFQCKDFCDCENDQGEQLLDNAEKQFDINSWKPCLNQLFRLTDRNIPYTDLNFIRSGHFLPEFHPPDSLTYLQKTVPFR